VPAWLVLKLGLEKVADLGSCGARIGAPQARSDVPEPPRSSGRRHRLRSRRRGHVVLRFRTLAQGGRHDNDAEQTRQAEHGKKCNPAQMWVVSGYSITARSVSNATGFERQSASRGAVSKTTSQDEMPDSPD